MKRIPFLILVFMLTTGFFKSALEECADIIIRDDYKFNKKEETISVKLTPKEIEEQKRLAKIEYSKCLKYKKPMDEPLDIRYTICSRAAKLTSERDSKLKEIRKISPEENNKKYKKFISQSLKKKMKDVDYEKTYSYCVYYKKTKPEMFKAKYD